MNPKTGQDENLLEVDKISSIPQMECDLLSQTADISSNEGNLVRLTNIFVEDFHTNNPYPQKSC